MSIVLSHDFYTFFRRADQIKQWAIEANLPEMGLNPESEFVQDMVLRIAKLVRNAALSEVLTLCAEMETHYADYAATALLNEDVDLSNAASGEPRACRFLAEQIRSMK